MLAVCLPFRRPLRYTLPPRICYGPNTNTNTQRCFTTENTSQRRDKHRGWSVAEFPFAFQRKRSHGNRKKIIIKTHVLQTLNHGRTDGRSYRDFKRETEKKIAVYTRSGCFDDRRGFEPSRNRHAHTLVRLDDKDDGLTKKPAFLPRRISRHRAEMSLGSFRPATVCVRTTI